jgi:hypothetical protein
MNDESTELLRQLIDAQKEQTELLRKHVLPLWTRIRFSLLMLLLLMTVMSVGLGATLMAVRAQNATAPAQITALPPEWDPLVPQKPPRTFYTLR